MTMSFTIGIFSDSNMDQTLLVHEYHLKTAIDLKNIGSFEDCIVCYLYQTMGGIFGKPASIIMIRLPKYKQGGTVFYDRGKGGTVLV